MLYGKGKGKASKAKAGRESMMLWAMFSQETLGPGFYVNVTLTHSAYLNIAADQVHPFMTTVLHKGTGPFQQDNAP